MGEKELYAMSHVETKGNKTKKNATKQQITKERKRNTLKRDENDRRIADDVALFLLTPQTSLDSNAILLANEQEQKQEEIQTRNYKEITLHQTKTNENEEIQPRAEVVIHKLETAEEERIKRRRSKNQGPWWKQKRKAKSVQ